MKQQQHVRVAILLATYNGTRFIEPQIRSLKENVTEFTVHWLDDHSTDNTRQVVRAAALKLGIHLREWHQTQHLGVPSVFFRLLECVDSDIYLFCDQDDIWQPGKIDATVANLLPDLLSPVLCFSDPLLFKDSEPGVLRRLSDVISDARAPRALEEARLFMSILAPGHTQGFTRPLRDIFLTHKDIARTHGGFGHDGWMHLIAAAAGTTRMLADVPTTLYRRHGENVSESLFTPKGNRIVWLWQTQQMLRRAVSRQAEGFVLAQATLPPGPKRERLLALARLVAPLNQRQSLLAIVRLMLRGAMWPSKWRTLCFAAVCLCSHAKGIPSHRP